METRGCCASCGEARMVLDEVHGVLACDSCGMMGNQDETELGSHWQIGHVIERGGTFVRENDSGAGAVAGLSRGQNSRGFIGDTQRWTERYRFEMMKKVESITGQLRVPGERVEQVKMLLESTLDGDWGTGRWTDILVAACVYIVVRQNQLPLTVPEVADCVDCDVVELGRMYNRILKKLQINLPNVDFSVFLERAVSTIPALRRLSKDAVRKMVKQGTFLLGCAQEWFITTGRRPLPVVAAVLSLVVEANKVVLEIADVARVLHAGLWATKQRYKEYQTALIGVAQSLPWGKDITLKNVPLHLPFLLQYLELKTKLAKKKEVRSEIPPSSANALNQQLAPSTAPQKSVAPCAVPSTQAGNDTCLTVSASKQQQSVSLKRPLERVGSAVNSYEASTRTQDGARSISCKDYRAINGVSDNPSVPSEGKPAECLKMSGFLCTCSNKRMCSNYCRSRRNNHQVLGLNMSSLDDEPHVEGVSETSTQACSTGDNVPPKDSQVVLEQERAKWEGLPVSFCVSIEARARRRVKIDLARSRIAKASTHKCRKTSSLSSRRSSKIGQEPMVPDFELMPKPKMKLDWEDLIIEQLMLCGAGEAELETGYYKSILAQFEEQTDTDLSNEDMTLYIRSKSEVELLSELRGPPRDFCPSK